MMWFIPLALVYLALLLVGLVLSFTTVRQPNRRNIRIASVVFTIPLWLTMALCIVAWFWFLKEPPSLAKLTQDFPTKRADLGAILRMSNEDVHFSRIAPDFLDRDSKSGDQPSDTHPVFGRYMKGDPKAGLSEERWKAYRKIYSRNGIKLGVQRDLAGDAFIMVDSVGFLDRGHATGYLHCAQTTNNTYRFEPCTLHREKGEHKYDPNTHEEGYSFQRIEGDWFAFDRGPG
jgi:hypothetical protein